MGRKRSGQGSCRDQGSRGGPPLIAPALPLLCVSGWWCGVFRTHSHAPSPPPHADAADPEFLPLADASRGRLLSANFAGLIRARRMRSRSPDWPSPQLVSRSGRRSTAQASPQWPTIAGALRHHLPRSRRGLGAGVHAVSMRKHQPSGTKAWISRSPKPVLPAGFDRLLEASAEQIDRVQASSKRCWDHFRPNQAAVLRLPHCLEGLSIARRQEAMGVSQHHAHGWSARQLASLKGGAGLKGHGPANHTYESDPASQRRLRRR